MRFFFVLILVDYYYDFSLLNISWQRLQRCRT